MNSVIADGARIKPVYAVEDLVVPGPAGEIPLRAYRPAPEALPVVVWLHGGGWVTGSIETHDLLCRQIAVAAGAMVVSVDYRLAPETKFPGAVEDCLAAWQWIGAHAAEIGGDADRVALGGDSAGGNLAAVVALLARDRGLPGAGAPTARVSGDRSRVRAPVDGRQRNRVLPRGRQHALVLRPLRAHRRRLRRLADVAAARARSRRPPGARS